MEWEKSAEAMWKQIFQIQKYDLVNWKLKYQPYKHDWKHFQFWEFFKNTSGSCFFKISNFVMKILISSEKTRKLINGGGVLIRAGGWLGCGSEIFLKKNKLEGEGGEGLAY